MTSLPVHPVQPPRTLQCSLVLPALAKYIDTRNSSVRDAHETCPNASLHANASTIFAPTLPQSNHSGSGLHASTLRRLFTAHSLSNLSGREASLFLTRFSSVSAVRSHIPSGISSRALLERESDFSDQRCVPMASGTSVSPKPTSRRLTIWNIEEFSCHRVVDPGAREGRRRCRGGNISTELPDVGTVRVSEQSPPLY